MNNRLLITQSNCMIPEDLEYTFTVILHHLWSCKSNTIQNSFIQCSPEEKKVIQLNKSWTFIVEWTNHVKVSHKSVNYCFLFIPFRIAEPASLRVWWESRCPVETKRRTEGRPSCLTENHIVGISWNGRFGQAKHGADESISAMAVEGRPALLFI